MPQRGTDGADQLRAVARQLRRQAGSKTRMKQFRAELRAPAKQVQKEVRAGIRAIPSKGQSRRAGSRSLRADLAKSVSIQVRTSGRKAGVYVFMNPRKMPDRKKALPAYFEGTPRYARLRHPVFGNREKWVTQRPHPYFTRATASAQAMAARAAEKVVDRLARELEGD